MFSPVNTQDDEQLPPGMIGLPRWMKPSQQVAAPQAIATAPSAAASPAPVAAPEIPPDNNGAVTIETPANPTMPKEPQFDQNGNPITDFKTLQKDTFSRYIDNPNPNPTGEKNGVLPGQPPAADSPVAAAPAAGMPATAAPAATPKPASPAAIPSPSGLPGSAELQRLSVRTPASMASGKYDIAKDQSRSGIEQIHNPFLRTLGRIGDVALSTLLPGAAVFTPGTQLHHQMNVNAARKTVEGEEGEAENARKEAAAGPAIADVESQTNLRNAQATKALREESGKVKDEQLLYDKNGTPIGYRDEKGTYYGPDDPKLPPGVRDVLAAAKTKTLKENTHFEKADDGSILAMTPQPDGTIKKEVVYHGDPKIQTEVKQIDVGGKPHQVLFNSHTGDAIKDLGQTGEKPPTVNVNAGISALDRESARFGKTHESNVKAANDQLEKIIEARSLLTTGNAESQALAIPKVLTALVSGQGTGVRITQPELSAIASARGIKGDFQGWIQKISSGNRLTPEQSRQLLGVLDTASQRLEQKRQISDEALNTINSGANRGEIVKADADARKKLADFEKGGSASGAPKTVKTKAEYDALPSGAKYIDPNGVAGTKK